MIANDDGEVFTFAASSKGALGALGKLSRIYAAHRRARPRVAGRQPRKRRLSASTSRIRLHQDAVACGDGLGRAVAVQREMALAGYEMPDSNEPAPTETPRPPRRLSSCDDMDDDIPF